MNHAPAIIALALLPLSAAAHPWGGLAVNQRGDIYFTFVCPPLSENHVACVWRLKSGEDEPRPVLVSAHDPSDIVLTRDANRTIYAAERVGVELRRTRLWRFSDSGVPNLVLSFRYSHEFSADAYAVGDDGTVFFSREDGIVALDPVSHPDSAFVREIVPLDLDRAGDLEVLAGGEFLIQSRGDLVLVNRHGRMRTLAVGLRQENPPKLSFSGANVLFDMTLTAAGHVLLAYYGNREVLRVEPDGRSATVLEAESPWSPSGVDEYDGIILVLESTTPAPAWKFWERTEIRPRIRAVNPDGSVNTLWEF